MSALTEATLMQIESGSRESNLSGMISRLEADRQRHARAILEIDRVLEQVGRAVGALQGDVGATPDAPRLELMLPARGKRGKFSLTGELSVLEFIGREGRPTTAEINAHWRREGRRGTANVILLRLLKTNQITRQLDPAVRGSRYVLTAQSSGAEGATNVDRMAPDALEPANAELLDE